MTLKDIYHHISAKTVAIFDATANKVHWASDPDEADLMPSVFGDREVVRLIPLDLQVLQITIR